MARIAIVATGSSGLQLALRVQRAGPGPSRRDTSGNVKISPIPGARWIAPPTESASSIKAKRAVRSIRRTPA
jgi:hypothetical protein